MCHISFEKFWRLHVLSYMILEIHIYCIHHAYDDKYYIYNILSVFRPILRKCIHQEYLLTGPW
jgi:hypothetical protein